MRSNQARIAVTGFALVLACACSLTPEQARAKIEARELSFDESGIGRAILSGDIKLLQLFITAEYDLNSFDDPNRAPLMLAARLPTPGVMELLIAAGARADELPGVLTIPATRGDRETMSMLLDAGADINSKNSARQTALHAAMQYHRADSMRFLLDNGADPNIGPTNLLVRAIETHRLKIADILIEAGADPHAGRKSAIQAAEQSGHEDLAQRLREASAR